MADIRYFYKDTTSGVFLIDGNAIPGGKYNMLFYSSDTIVELVDVTNNQVILGPIEIVNLRKENDTAYTNKADLLTDVADLFESGGGSGGGTAVTTSSVATKNLPSTNVQADKEQIDLKAIIDIPETQPVIDTGVMTLDCNNHWQAMFEGRTSVGTLVITDDFTIALSNASAAKLISLILTLTGTNQITFPNTVMCSNPSSKGTWANNVLTLASGTGVIVEFQLIWYASASKWQLKVSEEGVI